MDAILFVNTLKSKFNIKFLDIHTGSQFSSNVDAYRSQIRMNIVQNYSPLLSSFEKRHILNLDMLPVVENLFFSISHNKIIGGYAACDQRVGFDMEEVARISLESITRVSSKEELAACPDAKMLWSAKEAAFKASKKSVTISDVVISSWIQEDDVFYFEGTCDKLAQKVKGALIIKDMVTIACAFTN